MSTYARDTAAEDLTRGAVAHTAFLSWVAGLFEGEGTATITRSGRRGYTRPIISLTSTDRSIIDTLNKRWPGQVRTFQPKGNARIAHAWILNVRRNIARFIFDITPFIRTERVRRKLWLVFEDVGARVQGARSSVYLAECHARRERIHALNRRGKVPNLLQLEGPR